MNQTQDVAGLSTNVCGQDDQESGQKDHGFDHDLKEETVSVQQNELVENRASGFGSDIQGC